MEFDAHRGASRRESTVLSQTCIRPKKSRHTAHSQVIPFGERHAPPRYQLIFGLHPQRDSRAIVLDRPASPVLAGDSISIRLEGLPANADVKLISRARGVRSPGCQGPSPCSIAAKQCLPWARTASSTRPLPKARPAATRARTKHGLFWSMNRPRTMQRIKTSDVEIDRVLQATNPCRSAHRFINRHHLR